jgi:hypothetical protein
MARMHYSDIFRDNPNGTISPKVYVQLNGVTMGPGVTFGKGIAFGGVNLFDYRNKDIEIELINNVYIIKGFYN